MMGSVNYMTTIINMRAPGMTLFRMPLTIWSMFITAILQAFALPVLTAAGFMLVADRTWEPASSFRPALWSTTPHLRGWRAATTVAAPLLVLQPSGRVHHAAPGDGDGFRHDVVHDPQADHRLQADGLLDGAIAGLGFIVWGHHMFTSA